MAVYYLSFEVVAAGHDIEANETFYCWAHCARQEGAREIADHA